MIPRLLAYDMDQIRSSATSALLRCINHGYNYPIDDVVQQDSYHQRQIVEIWG